MAGVDSYTKLLLHFSKPDASYCSTVTSVNGANVSTSIKKLGSGSLNLTNGKYVTISNASQYIFGTSDFTIEFYGYFASVDANDGIISYESTTVNAWNISFDTDKNLVFRNDSNIIVSTADYSLNIWHHIAVVHSSGVTKLYIDGIEKDSANDTANYNKSNPSGIILGCYYTDVTGKNYLSGYVDEVRISNGIARWANNFILSDQPYLSDIYTVLLLHCDGENGSTSIPDASGGDESGNNHPVTYVGTAQTDTTQSKFGGSSLLLDGDSDYLTLSDSADWSLGTADFTIDLWGYIPTSMPTIAWFICQGYNYWAGGNGVGWGIMYYPAEAYLSFQRYNGSTATAFTFDVTLSVDTWNHIAAVRQGNTLTMYLNGISLGTADVTGVNYDKMNTDGLRLGSCLGGTGGVVNFLYKGYLEEVRISKGIARWTSNFTPPTSAYFKTTTNIPFKACLI